MDGDGGRARQPVGCRRHPQAYLQVAGRSAPS